MVLTGMKPNNDKVHAINYRTRIKSDIVSKLLPLPVLLTDIGILFKLDQFDQS